MKFNPVRKLPRSIVSEKTWRKVYKIESLTIQEHKCKYCSEKLTVRSATADHVVPRHSGGGTSAENIVASCRECNIAKGTMPEKAFSKLIKSDTIPRTANLKIMMVWSKRRIWMKANQVINNIKGMTGGNY